MGGFFEIQMFPWQRYFNHDIEVLNNSSSNGDAAIFLWRIKKWWSSPCALVHSSCYGDLTFEPDCFAHCRASFLECGYTWKTQKKDPGVPSTSFFTRRAWLSLACRRFHRFHTKRPNLQMRLLLQRLGNLYHRSVRMCKKELKKKIGNSYNCILRETARVCHGHTGVKVHKDVWF